MLDPGDIIAIHQLLARYGHHLDAQDWERFGDLWASDASIDYRGSTERTERSGRDAIVEWFASVGDRNPPAHLCTNIVVDGSADPTGEVSVVSKFMAPFSQPAHEPKRLYGGEYHDRVRRDDGSWRFVHRRCEPGWQLTVMTDDPPSGPRRSY